MEIVFKKNFEKQLKKFGIKIKDKLKYKIKLFIEDKYQKELNLHKLKG